VRTVAFANDTLQFDVHSGTLTSSITSYRCPFPLPGGLAKGWLMAVIDSISGVGDALRGRIGGTVFTDDTTLDRFSTDQSMYRIRPLAVVMPADVADVTAVVRFARDEGIPLTARGGGSGTAGAALGRGIVLVFDKTGPLNRVIGLAETAETLRVTVEPGLLHDALQQTLREHGYYLPADPSSGAISEIGGNIATKASGPHALKHGSINRYLVAVRFVTVDGELVDTTDESSIPARIRDAVSALRDDVLADAAATARLDARKGMKLASGYNLFAFLRNLPVGELVAQLLVGSIGTLGIIVRATLRAEPYVEGKSSMLLFFRYLEDAGDMVQYVKPLGVAAIEIINSRSLEVIRARNPDLGMPADETHLVMVEFEGPERHAQMAQVERLVRERGYSLAITSQTVDGEDTQARLWKIRKALLPTVRNYLPGHRALSLVNDVGVDPRFLAPFIEDVQAVFDRNGLVAAIYGHAGSGNLHLRPLFNLSDPHLPALLQRVADEVYEVVFRYDGTITAEHGMGRLRTAYLVREWGEPFLGYMRRLKQIFDPADILNPDVMFSNRSLTDDLDPEKLAP